MKERIDFKHPELTNMIEDCLRDTIIMDKNDDNKITYSSQLKRTIHKYSKDYYNVGFLKKLVVDIFKYVNDYMDGNPRKVNDIMQIEISDLINIIKEKRRIDNRENKFKRIVND
jgi:hypothetical protein